MGVRTDDSRLLDAFESLVRMEVSANARRWVFLHAAAVGWRGRAIILPAVSRGGKSRLVEALVRAGATYYSDEFAPIDSRGRVHPSSAPISRSGAARSGSFCGCAFTGDIQSGANHSLTNLTFVRPGAPDGNPGRPADPLDLVDRLGRPHRGWMGGLRPTNRDGPHTRA
jgi:hypothetical protein